MVRFAKFSALSVYTHGESHLLQRTVPGAFVTLGGVLLALILFLSEFRAAFRITQVQEMQVDVAGRTEMMMLRLNMTMLSLPCQALNLDLRDASGQRMTDATLARGGLHKMRIDRWGKTMGVEYVYPGYQVDYTKLAHDRQTVQELEQALNNHEGCQLIGTLQLKRMAGVLGISIHIQDFMALPENAEQLKAALERQHEENAKREPGSEQQAPVQPRVADMDQSRINVSHVLNDLEFGHMWPGKSTTLQGVTRLADQLGGVYRYYMSVVPTQYTSVRGKRFSGYQYSVTEYYGAHRGGDGRKPGVYFHYDVAPIAMKITEKRDGLGHFLVRLCAVIGGVFAVTGMIDRGVHKLFSGLLDSTPSNGRPGGHAAADAAAAGGGYGANAAAYGANAAAYGANAAAYGAGANSYGAGGAGYGAGANAYGGGAAAYSAAGYGTGGAAYGAGANSYGAGANSYGAGGAGYGAYGAPAAPAGVQPAGAVSYSSPQYDPFAAGSHKRTS